MSIRVVFSGILLAMSSLALVGCFSSSEVKSSNEASVGQQLTDLDRAYHQGIITEKEYMRLKKALIKRYD